MTASAGAVILPEHGADPSTVLQHAEQALRKAKAAGGNRTLAYAPEWNAAARRSLALEQDLREEFQPAPEFEVLIGTRARVRTPV